MGWLLRLLMGSAGPYIAGAVGAILVVATITAQVQTVRLHHAKADLDTARKALIDPATKRTWQVEAVERGINLTTCTGNLTDIRKAVDIQNHSIVALEAEGHARVTAATKALAAEHKRTEDTLKVVARINQLKPGADRCASAASILRGDAE